MNSALSYLRNYLVEPRVIPTLDAADPLMSQLPNWWGRVLAADGNGRIHQAIHAWEEYRAQLPLVFDFLSIHLQTVNLLTNKDPVTGNTSVRLLYELVKDGRTMYYTGGNPGLKSMTTSVKNIWDRLPVDFRRFYDSHHNGWYYLASNSMGPSPTEDFFILDDLEWGILEDIGDPGCDLKDLLAVYTNGMGGYVALSLEQQAAYGDVLWWKDKSPRLNIDAWGVMDAWTEIGLNK